MKPRSIRLHEALIRMAKGMLKAWETWLEEAKTETN